jgi:hypothetical protein
MDKEQKALKDFLGDLGGNNEEATLDLGQEEVKQETLETTPEPVEEEKLPFHKDPKVQRYIERQLEKKLKDFQPSRQEQFQKEVQDENPLVDAFTEIIGNDTPEKVSALKALKNAISSMEERTLKAEEASKYIEESRKAQEEERQAMAYLEDGLERIEENFDVDLSSNSPLAKKTRNEFLDFLGRISPKDENGEVSNYADPEESFKIFQSMKKPETNTQAKQIVSRGMSRSSTDATNTPTKRITFDNVREMMGLEN